MGTEKWLTFFTVYSTSEEDIKKKGMYVNIGGIL